MKRIIHYALHQPLFIVLGTLLFALAGVIAFQNLSVEAFPDVTDTQVMVIALYPGRAAEEVEKQVTLPIETALAGLPNSIRVFSHTQFGLSFTVVTYDDAAQVQQVRQQVAERLRGIDLPPGVEADIAPNATPVGEIMRYRLRGDGLTTTELRTLEDWVVERGLRQVPGVADVVAMGGFIKQYEVQPDLDKLRAYKLTFQNLLDALGRGNSNAGGSYVAQGAQQYAIRGIGLLRSADDIGRIVVAARNGTPILIRDIAQVKIGAVPRLGTVGQDADDDVVTGIVLMQKLERTMDVVARLRGTGRKPPLLLTAHLDEESRGYWEALARHELSEKIAVLHAEKDQIRQARSTLAEREMRVRHQRRELDEVQQVDFSFGLEGLGLGAEQVPPAANGATGAGLQPIGDGGGVPLQIVEGNLGMHGSADGTSPSIDGTGTEQPWVRSGGYATVTIRVDDDERRTSTGNWCAHLSPPGAGNATTDARREGRELLEVAGVGHHGRELLELVELIHGRHLWRNRSHKKQNSP